MSPTPPPPHLGGPAPLLVTYATNGTLLAAWVDAAWLRRRWRLVELQRSAAIESGEPVRLDVEEPALRWINRHDIVDAVELGEAIRPLGATQRWTMVPAHHLPRSLPLQRTTADFSVDSSGRAFHFSGLTASSASREHFRTPGTDTREICHMQLRVVPDTEVPAVLLNLVAESSFDAAEALLTGVPVPGGGMRDLLSVAGAEAIAAVLEQAPTRQRERLIARLSEARAPARPVNQSVRR